MRRNTANLGLVMLCEGGDLYVVFASASDSEVMDVSQQRRPRWSRAWLMPESDEEHST